MRKALTLTLSRGTGRGDKSEYLAWTFVFLGIFLRLLRYTQGRSLWLDEVFLANNLIHKSPLGLLGQLDYRQGAPPLFLLLCKLSITFFGPSEYALRLIPLIAGVLSVIIFYLLARKILRSPASLAAIALFSILEPLIYYSSEIKQYSMDVLVAITILWAAKIFAIRKKGAGVIFVLGVVGLFASHPAIFVLAGASIWLLQSRTITIRVLLPLWIGWGIAFAADYWFFLRPLSANAGLQHHWAIAYPPLSSEIFPWLWTAAKELFAGYDTIWLRFTRIGIWPAYAGMLLAAMGCINLFRHRSLGLIAWPIVLTLLASILHKYPFSDRLILFLVPMIVLMIGAAFEGSRLGIVIVLFAAVLIPTAGRAAMFAVHPPGREEIKPVLVYLKNHWQFGDVLYIYHAADAPYLYYHDSLGLHDVPFIHGHRETEDPDAFANDVRQLAGNKRVWILFSHVWEADHGDEREELLQLLRENGKQRDAFESTGASVYLFEMRNR